MYINSINLFNITGRYNNSCFDNTNFSGSATGADGTKMRKALHGITCPCCGIKMLSTSDINSVLKFPPNEPSKNVIPALDKYKNQLHGVEKDIFYTLKALSVDYPDLNLRELLDMEREHSLKLLHDDENKIIGRIRKIGHFLSEDSMTKLEKTLSEAEQFINQPDLDSTFKRRVFIAKIADTTNILPEKDAAETIFDISHEIPRAGNNKAAFIVKYTEKKPSTGVERNAHDIIRGILYPSIGTIEHIKIRSPKFKHGGGKNNKSNYILECQRDNNMRDSKTFLEFVTGNPQFFGEYLQKYIDTIIDKLNNGKLKGFEDYPKQIARTLRYQSKGKIKIDISKLKPKNVSEN